MRGTTGMATSRERLTAQFHALVRACGEMKSKLGSVDDPDVERLFESDVPRALRFIEANRDRPFFAYLAYTLPHVELTCPADSWEAYKGKWPKIARVDGGRSIQTGPI